ncbi:MAG: DNA primase, partial [Thermoanaerobaculia bacterium]
MPLIDLNDAVISQVRHAADIVDLVSQFTPLKQAGRSHKGLCPFHREKTPSFHVDRGKGMFYCFGCGTGGDVFKFIMLTERMNFPEAVEYVANRAGIDLPRRKEARKGEADRENLLEAIEEAADAFHQALGWTPNAAEAYLRKRGVDEELWRKYGFGYAPDSWDYILKRLGRKFQPKKLEAAGLVLPRKSGDGFYDRFRNRLIVPIHSESGSILGFGGRSLDGSDPKYLNSPESEIFNKSRLLYNLHRARDAMRRMERAILVEGYFDCVTLDHAGVDGVVASMGTSLTTGQAALIRRFSRRAVVCYDGDEAGRNATLRAAPVLLAQGLQVDVVDVGPGEDPDTFLRKRGLDAFIELLATPEDLFDFAIKRVAPNPAALRGAEKSEAVEALVPLVAAVADPVMRNDAAQRVADRLGLEFSSVWARVRAGGGDPARTGAPAPRDLDGVVSGEKEILRVLVHGLDPDITTESLRADFFRDPACRLIFETLAARGWSGAGDVNEILDSLRSEDAIAVLSSVSFAPELDPTAEERRRSDTRSMVLRMRRDNLDDRLRMTNAEIKQAQDGGDVE